MVEDRIGYRYAKSLFELAKEKDLLEPVRADMNMIHETAEASRDFVLMLKSPLIPASKKEAILHSLFKDKLSSNFSELLINIIVRKGRERYLDNVAKAFLVLYDVEKHIQRGKLISAEPLEEAQIAEIKKIVEQQTGDSFEIDIEVDPSLIGGFILKIGDKLFDGSVSNQLREIKQDFVQNTYIKKF